MNKLKVFISVMVALLATVTSFANTAANHEDIVYAKTVKASVGGTVELPIYLKNPSYKVKSLTFTIVLPDGITFDGYKTTKMADFSEWNLDFATKTGENTNTALAQMYYTKDATTSIASGDVELFTISLKVDANISAGTKSIAMNKITLVDATGAEKAIVTGDESITSNLNIQRAEVISGMPDGYGFEIAPFVVNTGENTINFVYKATADVRTIEFDLKLPKGLLMYNSDFSDASPIISTDNTQGTPTVTLSNVSDDRTSAHVAFTGAAGLSKKYFKSSTNFVTCATLKTLVLSEEQFSTDIPKSKYGIEEGVQKIEISNISMQDNTITTSYYTGNYIASVIVGTPTDPNPIVYGDITSANQVTAAIPTGATSVDISQATASNDVVDAIVTDAQTKNANAIVYAPSTYDGTKDNVIKSDAEGNLTCSSFKMTDGANMNVPASFAAASATYSRDFATGQNWGTICLPYDVESNGNVEYYNITGVESGAITIVKYDKLPAGTPALVRKVSSSTNVESKASAAVTVSGALDTKTTGTITMHGSYTKDTKVENANAYYISNNKFWKCKNNFYVDAFRAYFVLSSEAKPSVLEINEDVVTTLNALTNTEADVKIEAVYGVNGALQNGLQPGMNIVKLSNGKTQKILVK